MKFEKYSSIGSKPPSYIEIKESTIPKAGQGAFATVDIPTQTTIGEYLGKIYNGKEMENARGAYLFSVRVKDKEIKIIDGKSKSNSSWVRFVNSPLKYEDGNAHFYQYDQRIFIKTRKPIKKGEEIFAYYGDEYVDEKLRN
jgi:hypothetical protein